jgi:hypothetical protein
VTKNIETQVPARAKLSIRAGVSRKLLERKALEAAAAADEPAGDALEDSFPATVQDQASAAEAAGAETVSAAVGHAADEHAGSAIDIAASTAPAPAPAPQEPAQTAPEQPTAIRAPQPATAAAWSAEDESAFQALTARRKAAGYQRRGRDVSDQVVRLGSITPNPNTVVAVIVGLITERGGSVGRSDLVVAMAGATYPHGKAKPENKGWCQGYVAGAVRNGFIALADEIVVIADAA